MAYTVTPPSDYFPALISQVSNSNMTLSPVVTVFLNSVLEGFWALLDTAWPPTAGFIAIAVFETPFPETMGLPGVSFELIEATGVSFYINEEWRTANSPLPLGRDRSQLSSESQAAPGS